MVLPPTLVGILSHDVSVDGVIDHTVLNEDAAAAQLAYVRAIGQFHRLSSYTTVAVMLPGMNSVLVTPATSVLAARLSSVTELTDATPATWMMAEVTCDQRTGSPRLSPPK